MIICKASELDGSFFEGSIFEELPIVKEILCAVRDRGDKAVREYTKKFDGITLKEYEIKKEAVRKAYSQVDEETIRALNKAAERIRVFAEKQLEQLRSIELDIGCGTIGQNVIPIEKVGCYVPGGKYPLISSALMSIIPAKVAGVKEIIVCSPKISNELIVAADMAGADRIFSVGGVQAIGAMAYGTETVPKVDKIVGPGNKYVANAKKEVYGIVGIDFIAGPSEIMIIADENGNASYIAADLIAQAEHDKEAVCCLITTSNDVANEVNEEIDRQLIGLRTSEIACASLGRGRIIIVESLSEAIEIANRKAPEHLELQVKNPSDLAIRLNSYGALFLGEMSAEVFGDYCSGTNHILPTGRSARYSGGLSVRDFVKIVTYQRFTKKPDELIDIASMLAEAEGLYGHRTAAQIRK